MPRTSALRRLVPYYHPYRAKVAVGLLLVVGAAAASAIVPWLLRAALDSLGTNAPPSRIRLIALAMIAAAILSGLLRFGMRDVMNGVSRRIEYDLRNDLFGHLTRLDARYFAVTRTGELMARLTNDLNAVRMAAGPAVMYLTNTVAGGVFALVPKIAELGITGTTIEGYGCPGMSHVAAGLVAVEMARGDGSLNTFFGVHSGLAMSSIEILGSEEQKEKWLPPMARLEKIGAFGLTEPYHGSDIVRLETTARREGDEYVIDGAKRWIGNATFADVTVIWARDEEDGEVKGFLVEKGAEGFSAEVMTGKMGKRAVWQADIKLEGVRVPRENKLAGADTFKNTAEVLTATRAMVAWEAIGHAVASYEAAVTYAKEREQFGQPIAGFQIIQNKLANMLAEITSMQLLCLRLTQLQEAGKMTGGMASLAKMNNARKAKQVCSDARDIMGGNGILLEYYVARHLSDMEIVYTYEGTDTIQSLIVGREITGVGAFV